MSWRRTLGAALLSGALAGIASIAIAAGGKPDDAGRQRYNAVGCWQCHGYEGQGGAGPRIGPKPLAFPAFANAVRHPRSEMPPYNAKVLPDEDLRLIYNFLVARAPPVALPGAGAPKR